MINSVGKCNKIYNTIDIDMMMYYSKDNIPAKPLPKGMRNLAGLLLGVE
jgi:hypothetical protein